MKLFIAGPAGAGKTIFATMFTHWAETSNSLIQIKPTTFETKQCISNHLNDLSRGIWPGSTLSKTELNWDLVIDGKSVPVLLLDLSGQNIQQAMRGIGDQVANSEIFSHQLESDLVILLVDPTGHQGSTRSDDRIANVWIYEKILQGLRPEQKIILCVTKADALPELTDWKNRDQVLDIVDRYMPEIKFRPYFRSLDLSKHSILAVSSIFNTVSKVDGGYVKRFPGVPLKSEGMQYFTDELVRLIRIHRSEASRHEDEKRQNQYISVFWKVLKFIRNGIAIAIVLYVILIIIHIIS